MKKTVKNVFYTTAWLALTSLNSVNALDLGPWKVDPGLAWSQNDVVTVLQNWLVFLTTLLSIVAVVMILWWWFNILTAWWEEDKVKKGKTILIQAVAWLIVIFLAYSIINWVINLLFANS